MSFSVSNWPVNRVRQEFIDFFIRNGHKFYPSSSVIPHDDPTILFTNAGMNQFKKLFLGTADPQTEFGRLKRAVNSQLCIRAGGKHNDLDDVGKDTYHHTFFEMLGCWSFGDYSKKEIIRWSWELLVDVYKLPPDQLYATYFGGDHKNGLSADTEARDLWAQFLPDDHIIPGNVKDNFWEMGDIGPCGPCSELHFDRIGGRCAASLVNKDDPMVVEIWNLVFIQFDRREGGSLVSLPAMHVDTGMGLERLTAALQDVVSNYDTDIWTSLFDDIQKVCGCEQKYSSTLSGDIAVAYRVVADHIRCLTVALSDGAVPDSVGRGFVLRRIIRRAVRYGIQILGAKPGFLSQLVPSVANQLGEHFQHLRGPNTLRRIVSILHDEEFSFEKTWSNGLKHFESAKSRAINGVISGGDTFILHDRYGFPVDLTLLMAEKEKLRVDVDGFQKEMNRNQLGGERMSAAKAALSTGDLELLRQAGIPQTMDSAKYESNISMKATILGIIQQSSSGSKILKSLSEQADFEKDGDNLGIILDATSFYSEGGGQIYDTGYLTPISSSSYCFQVEKVYSSANFVVHFGKLVQKDMNENMPQSDISGLLKVGDIVELHVDYDRRNRIAANHSITHQLNWTLRHVLEDENPNALIEVHQRGSLVTETYLRFDFSYHTKLSVDQLKKIEELLNMAVKNDLIVESRLVPLKTIFQINGLRCMKGEQYPDPVRIHSIGKGLDEIFNNPESASNREVSIELCGGTHLKSLSEAQHVIILSEDGLTKGIRRIVILTREEAFKSEKLADELESSLESLLSLESTEETIRSLSLLGKKINDSSISLIRRIALREKCEKEVKHSMSKLKTTMTERKERAIELGISVAQSLISSDSPEKDSMFLVLEEESLGAERELIQAFLDSMVNYLGPDQLRGIFLCGIDRNTQKALCMAIMPSLWVGKGLSAVEWIKAVAKGGGKPTSAQCGISFSQVEESLEKARLFSHILQEKLNTSPKN